MSLLSDAKMDKTRLVWTKHSLPARESNRTSFVALALENQTRFTRAVLG